MNTKNEDAMSEILKEISIYDIVMSYIFVSLKSDILNEREIRLMRFTINKLLDDRYTFDDYYDLLHHITNDNDLCNEAYLDLKELAYTFKESNNDYEYTSKKYKIKSSDDSVSEFILMHILSLKKLNNVDLLYITLDVLFLCMSYNAFYKKS